MKLARRTVLLGLPALAACGSTVQTPPLALKPMQALQWRSFVDPQLRHQIGLGQVEGGEPEAREFLDKALRWLWGSHTPNEVLQDALEDQLRALALLAATPQAGRYRLDARVITLEVDGLMGSADAKAKVEYTVREREAQAGATPIYQRQVRSQGQAGWLDHVLSGDRQRLAQQAALRAGLILLAQDLVALRL